MVRQISGKWHFDQPNHKIDQQILTPPLPLPHHKTHHFFSKHTIAFVQPPTAVIFICAHTSVLHQLLSKHKNEKHLYCSQSYINYAILENYIINVHCKLFYPFLMFYHGYLNRGIIGWTVWLYNLKDFTDEVFDIAGKKSNIQLLSIPQSDIDM